jgi:hypothetical protein
MVLKGGGRSEDRHHRITDELLDGPARHLDLLSHRVVEAVEHRARPLRILRSSEDSRANEVREEHCCQLSLFGRRRGELDRRGATRAETRVDR